MALVLADRIRETTTTTSTGTITLAGAVTGFRTFATVGNANTTYYTISGQNTSEWEVGIGTYTAAGTTLSRDTVLSSSNAGSLVAFSAGTKDVYVVYPAGKSVNQDANGGVTIAAPTSGVALSISQASTTAAVTVSGGTNPTYQTSDGTVTGKLQIVTSTSSVNVGAQSSHTLNLITNNSNRLAINNAGAVTIAAPTSGNALTVTGFSGTSAVNISGSGVASISVTQTGMVPAVAAVTTGTSAISQTNGSGFYSATADWVGSTGSNGLFLTSPYNTGTAMAGFLRLTRGTGNNYIGLDLATTTAHPIRFSTNATTENAGVAMTIASGGNVTIAAPTSGVALLVNGTTTSGSNSNAFNVFTDSTNYATHVLRNTNAAGNAAFSVQGGNAVLDVAVNANFGSLVGSIGTNTAHSFALNTSGTARLTINSTGNATINAPSSGTSLQVNQTSTGAGLVITDGTYRAQLDVYSGGFELGTTSNHNFNVFTNSVTRFQINNSGNVTINTPTSGSALTVNGIAGNYALLVQGGPAYGGIVPTASNIQLYAGGSGYGIDFITNALVRQTISSTGNITINAPASGFALAVSGSTQLNSAASDEVLQLRATSNPYVSFYQAGTLSGYIQAAGSNFYLVQSSAGSMLFNTGGNNRVNIGNAGNVTIYAPGSGVALDVAGHPTNSVTALLEGTGTGANLIRFNNTGGNGYVGLESSGGGVTGSGITAYSMAVATTGATSLWLGTNNSGRVQIGSAGNVTIATPTSGIPLTVNASSSLPAILVSSASGQYAGIQFQQATQNAIYLYNPAGTSSLTALVGGADRFTINNNGNVIIATPTSGVALTVNGSTYSNSYEWNPVNTVFSNLLNTSPDVAMLTKGSGVLGDGLFGDELAFNLPTTSELWNGSAWSSTTVVGACFTGKNSSNFSAAYTLTSATYSKIRFTWNSFGYRFWDALAWVGSANGSQYSAKIESSTDGVTWVTNLPDTAAGSDYPGYHVIRNQSNNSTSQPYLRITISVTAWGPTSSVWIGNISLYGSYGGAYRLFDWDYQRSIVNYGTLSVNSSSISGTSLTVNGVAGNVFQRITDGTRNYDSYSSGGVWYTGTSTATDLGLFTNSTEKMRITSAGNVTINAPTSGVPLTINGLGATNTAVIYFQSSTTGSQYVQYNNSGNTTNVGIESSAGGTLVGGSSAYSTVLANNGARDLILGTNNATRMKIDSSGSVTINTPSSGAALTVNGVVNFDSTPRIGYLASSDTFAEGGLTIPNYGMVWGVNTAISAGVSTNISGYSGIGLFTAGTRRITIGGSGNVTIAAPSSGVPLTIVGIAGGGTPLRISNGTAVMEYQTDSGGNGYLGLTNANSLFLFTGGSSRVQIGSAGAVTINAPTSGVALSVGNGAGTSGYSILAGGAVKFSGASTIGATEVGVINYEYPVTRFYIGDGTGYYFRFAKRSASTTTDLFSIADTGNVSIAAPTSGTAITANGASAALVLNATNSGAYAQLQFGNGSGQGYLYGNGGSVDIISGSTSWPLRLGFGTGTMSTECMRVTGQGGVQITDTAGTLFNAGYLGVPQNSQTGAYVLVLADRGKHISITTGGVTVNASIFSAGDAITIYNNSASSQTITQGTSVTMYLGGTATTGNRTLAQRGVCTVLCVASNTFVISGAGLT